MSMAVVRFGVAGTGAGPLAPSIGEPGPRFTVVYDGHCNVCSRLVKLLTKWDRNHELEIIPSQKAGVRQRFPWIPARSYVESVQVIRNSDGKTWQAAAALEEILNAMPKGRLISWLFRIPLVRPLVDRFYRWFARNRYKFGCGDHCAVRPADLDYRDGAAGTR
jgi:predicted DCC family thiol-disulfide oxidoreductase YuxK